MLLSYRKVPASASHAFLSVPEASRIVPDLYKNTARMERFCSAVSAKRKNLLPAARHVPDDISELEKAIITI